MESDISDTLEDLRWGKDAPESILLNWIEYSNLISWISLQISSITDIDEVVNAMTKTEDLGIFQMELSSFLKELGCPYNELTSVELSKRFVERGKKLLVLHFLLTELQAARMVHIIDTNNKKLTVSLNESPQAKCLREILQTLECGKPPETISASALCSKIDEKIFNRKQSKNLVEEPLFRGVLSSTQWQNLEDLNEELQSEYQMRREMLLKRLDVTIQSFGWSDRLKSKKDDMAQLYGKHRQAFCSNSSIKISDLLTTRVDLAVIEKSSNSSVRKFTRSAVNNVTIGRVPDRGGRPDEVQPPPPEMPPWQQRQGAPAASGSSGWIQGGNQRGGNRGGGGGGPRGGGGGRVQGGWSAPAESKNYDNRGGYSGRGNSGYQDQNMMGQQQQYANQSFSRGGGNNAPQFHSNQNDYYNQGQQGYDNQDQYNTNRQSRGGGNSDMRGNGRPYRGNRDGGYNRGYNNRY